MINRLRAGETSTWDLINVNNPWARKVMLPENLIKPLDRATFQPFWIEFTSTVNNPYLSPLAAEFLAFVQAPDVAHTVGFAEGTYNPVAQMGNPDCFSLFTKEELDAIQWDSLEEEMARSAEYDIVPDHDAALDLMMFPIMLGLSTVPRDLIEAGRDMGRRACKSGVR